MVTGDHPLTAEAIARKVGLVTLKTRREVAAEDDVDEAEISLSDPRVGAVVVSGSRLRELTTVRGRAGGRVGGSGQSSCRAHVCAS